VSALAADSGPTPLGESLARLERLVSPCTGIVRHVQDMLATTGDAQLVAVAAELADATDLVGAPIDAKAVAWSSDRDAAVAAAIGEAVERYSAGLMPEEVVLATAEELAPTAVDPERFALFHPDQYAKAGFPPRPFTRSTPVRWIRGFRIPNGEPAWLPAQLVSLGALPLAPSEELIGYATSSGLACRPTFEEALLRGLLEVIERDAFMITWANCLSLPLLAERGNAELERFRLEYLDPTGLRFAVVDLSDFHRVPTMLGLVRGDGPGDVALAVGAGCAVRACDAWKHSLEEAFAARAWARGLRAERGDRAWEESFSGVVDFDDHVYLYALPEVARHADFLDAAPATRAMADVADLEGGGIRGWIEALALRLDEVGVTAYAVDVTAPDVRAAGLSVVKVVAPELCPLDVPHLARFHGGSRLYEAAFRLGLSPAPLDAGDVNPYPHPFP
jgi:ribosomal protein S12 methylthiotransferase accessory factor